MYFWEIFDFIGLPFVCGVTAGVNLPDTGNAVLVWCHNCLMSLMGQDMVSELIPRCLMNYIQLCSHDNKHRFAAVC